MNKSTKKTSAKKRLILGGTTLVVLLGIGAGVHVIQKRKNRITYQVTKVNRADIRMTILSTGTVAPENRLDLKAPVAGRVEKVVVQEGNHVHSGQILAWMSSTERAALIDTARSKGPNEVAYWEENYKMTPLVAPGNGLIILKNADAGQTVTQTDIILSMSDHLIVKANVDETDLSQVKLSQKVTIILDAFPNSPLDARVMHIGYDAKTVNNVTTYEVDVIADKTPVFMKSGMTANVTFQIAEKDDTLTVPAAAIRREHKKTYVLIPNSEPGLEPTQKEVELGISDGKKIEILSGVAEGDTILTAAVRSLSQKKDDYNTSPFGSMNGNRSRPPAPPGH
jgi:membrane fusion protein, macrolide-specific efflux system